MMELHQFEREDVPTQRIETDDSVEYVVDLGPTAASATVDVVDDTVMVVHGEDQYDISLPAANAEAFIHNGLLTVTMEDSA